MAELKAPESLGIWIFNVQSAVWCFAGLWAEPLSVKFTHRVVAVLSALLCAAAIMISAIIKNPYLFFVTVSLMYGIGGGICVSCCFQINRRYFSKRLGMANGLMLCGGTLGMAMMSTLAGTLHNWFDFFHSTLIMGALPLIPAVTSLITFRSKKPYWEPRQQEEEHRRSHFFLATAFGGSHLVGATYVLPSLWSTPYSFSTGESVSFRDYVISIFKLSFLDGDVMAVAAVTGLTQFIMINVYTVSSYALKQANVSSNNLMVFLWVAGLADLFSRLCCSFIVDHQTINIELLYIFGQMIFMIMTFMMAFFRESWAVVLICAAGFGISLGIIYVLDILVMIYRFGHEKFQSVFGVCMVFRSFCALVIGPIGGLIRELFQDYAPTFLFYNSILFLAFVLLCHHGTCQNDVIPRLPVLPSS
ncbi:monocarboxylate transporter 2-like [Penaeus chinensis]|uniref:monocarboxylate transporter 2-like n=1 Tax=Penaeus chinensis TaxID=139456 RepID=UPI001FB626DF|nr:monocarboxylate transporter 2-like [Penaeus chinensis]